MKRILVPVDFSENSVFAVDIAVRIANSLKSKLRLMHVRTGKQYFPDFAKDNPRFIIEDNDEAYMAHLVDRAKARYDVENGVVDYKFRQGNVVKEITNQAHYDDSIIIVCGTHGVSGFEDRWIGSNAYRLVSNAPCPVLAVRKEMDVSGEHKILIPIDWQKVSRMIVPNVTGFAKIINAKLLIVGVTRRSRWSIPGLIAAYVRQVERFLRKSYIDDFESQMIDGTEGPKDMLDYAKSHGVTIIALPVKRSGNPFENVFYPFANELLNMSDLPVLAIPEYEGSGTIFVR